MITNSCFFPVLVDLGSGIGIDPFGETDTLISIERAVGTGGSDTLIGGDGADILRGGPGIDTIDGGAGTDTAEYSGSVGDYVIAPDLSSVSGPDGTDTLIGIERLRFDDGTFFPDPLPNAAPVLAVADLVGITGVAAPAGDLAEPSDPDGDQISVWSFQDQTFGGGRFEISGLGEPVFEDGSFKFKDGADTLVTVTGGVNTETADGLANELGTITVVADRLSHVTFAPGNAGDADTLAVQVEDAFGLASPWETLTFSTVSATLANGYLSDVLASGSNRGGDFGASVALSADGVVALVGAPENDLPGAPDQGAAYVYRWDGTAWTETQLAASDGEALDRFGSAVALSADGQFAVVGAPDADLAGDDTQGAVYLFEWDGAAWTEQTLTLGTPTPGAHLGASVDISDDGLRVLAGAPGDLSAGDAGGAVVFDIAGGGIVTETLLDPEGGMAVTGRGFSVALSADGATALVGAAQGSATVYETDPVTVQLNGSLLTSDDGGGGVALSADGTRALVGSPNDDLPGNIDQGSAYVFDLVGSTWTEDARLIRETGTALERFGETVALAADGATVVVGSEEERAGADDSEGAATQFNDAGGGVWRQTPLIAEGRTPSEDFGAGLALTSDGATALIGGADARLFAAPPTPYPIATAGPDALAVDDDSPPADLRSLVLSNDSDAGDGPLELIGIDTAGTVGTVTFNRDAQTLSYDAGPLQSLNLGETAPDSFGYIVRNESGALARGTVDVTVTGTDNAPEVFLPNHQTSPADTALILRRVDADDPGNVPFVVDPDAGEIVTTVLAVDSGTLTVAPGSGATVQDDGTATVTVSGTVDQVNAALGKDPGGPGLTFTPPAMFTGIVTLTATTTDDGGNEDSASTTIGVTGAVDLYGNVPADAQFVCNLMVEPFRTVEISETLDAGDVFIDDLGIENRADWFRLDVGPNDQTDIDQFLLYVEITSDDGLPVDTAADDVVVYFAEAGSAAWDLHQSDLTDDDIIALEAGPNRGLYVGVAVPSVPASTISYDLTISLRPRGFGGIQETTPLSVLAVAQIAAVDEDRIGSTRPRPDGDTAYHFGYAGSDTLVGTQLQDILYGGFGVTDGSFADRDSITGSDANDLIIGGVDDDTADGGSGEDVAFFNGERLEFAITKANGIVTVEHLDGGVFGTDTLTNVELLWFGEDADPEAADVVGVGDTGSDNDDLLVGTAGSDTVNGLAGDDTLTGLDGDDTLIGGDGDDTVDGGPGADLIVGGSGAGDDTYAGGDDTDTVSYASTTAGVVVDLAAGTATGSEIGTDGLSGIEIVVGGSGGDTLTGSASDNELSGGFGNDFLVGGAGNDVLHGNDGRPPPLQAFSDPGVFPEVTELVDIGDLPVPGDGALGLLPADTALGEDAVATLTFAGGISGYHNSMGTYTVAGDGTIGDVSMAFTDVKALDVGDTASVGLPGGGGAAFGLFLVVHGAGLNGGYAGLDFDVGTLSFVFDHGGGGERAAKITDAPGEISLVFDDGASQTVLEGPVVHATDRGGPADLNPDGDVHVAGGRITAGETTALRVGFEDQPGGGDGDFNDVIVDIAIHPGTASADDTLAGGSGDDTLTGGIGEDLFQFGAGGGTDRITDFQVGSDRFELLDGLTISAIATVDADGDTLADDTTVTLSDGAVEIIGVVGVSESDLLGV